MFKKVLFVAFVCAGSVVSFKIGRGASPTVQVQMPSQAQACSDEDKSRDPYCWCGCCLQCPMVGCAGCAD